MEKEDGKAFSTYLKETMKDVKAHILKKTKDEGIGDLTAELIRSMAEEHVKEEDAKADAPNYDSIVAVKREPQKKRASATKKSATSSKRPKKEKEEEEEEEEEKEVEEEEEQEEEKEKKDEEIIIEPTPKKRGRKKSGDVSPSVRVKKERAEKEKTEPKKRAKTTAKKGTTKSLGASLIFEGEDLDLTKPIIQKKKRK